MMHGFSFNRIIRGGAKLFVFSLLLLTSRSSSVAEELNHRIAENTWHGFEKTEFEVMGRAAYVVSPSQPAAANPWIWRARFPGYHDEMDVELVKNGFHIAHVNVAGMFGSPQAIKIGNAFYEQVVNQFELAPKVVLEGVSRGGLLVYNWAAHNPHRVACIYCDTPVCDIKSWPGGKGAGLGADKSWQQCLTAFGLSEENVEAFAGNPIDHAAIIAKSKIPILHIVSENDRVVPPQENSYELKRRLTALGHSMEIISVSAGTEKSNGHHFTHPQPQRVVQFVSTYGSSADEHRIDLLKRAKRIVFLGDSITFAGHYVGFFDTWIQTQKFDRQPIIIDAGLSSETVSGLSEEGHAKGRFPRPDLAERLDRVLAVTKPDLIFACYGMNCGIYQPFDQARFQKYQQGIKHLIKSGDDIGAEVVLITPPMYDDLRGRTSFPYDDVLSRYAEWLLTLRDSGVPVIDLHSGMKSALLERRKTDPEFTYQRDAVHPNVDGHWVMAQQLIRWFGDSESASAGSAAEMLEVHGLPVELHQFVSERLNTRRNAYVGAAGHKRPGVKPGLPVDEAEAEASRLTRQIEALATPN